MEILYEMYKTIHFVFEHTLNITVQWFFTCESCILYSQFSCGTHIFYFSKSQDSPKFSNHNGKYNSGLILFRDSPNSDLVSPLAQNCKNITGIVNEPGHEKMCLMPYANNKGADQPAHPCSLISAFVVRWLDSIISLDSIAEISRL